jgi:hypothetical protein
VHRLRDPFLDPDLRLSIVNPSAASRCAPTNLTGNCTFYLLGPPTRNSSTLSFILTLCHSRASIFMTGTRGSLFSLQLRVEFLDPANLYLTVYPCPPPSSLYQLASLLLFSHLPSAAENWVHFFNGARHFNRSPSRGKRLRVQIQNGALLRSFYPEIRRWPDAPVSP